LYIPDLKSKFEKGEAGLEDPLCGYSSLRPSILAHLIPPTARHVTHFPLSSKTHPYTIISPMTPLEDLEDFFAARNVDFALGETFPYQRTHL
jgi:hypothetical protein